METETHALCTPRNGPVRVGVEMMGPAREFGLGKLSHYLLELHIIWSQVELDYHRVSLLCPGRVFFKGSLLCHVSVWWKVRKLNCQSDATMITMMVLEWGRRRVCWVERQPFTRLGLTSRAKNCIPPGIWNRWEWILVNTSDGHYPSLFKQHSY